jgi:hypothetical protein
MILLISTYIYICSYTLCIYAKSRNCTVYLQVPAVRLIISFTICAMCRAKLSVMEMAFFLAVSGSWHVLHVRELRFSNFPANIMTAQFPLESRTRRLSRPWSHPTDGDACSVDNIIRDGSNEHCTPVKLVKIFAFPYQL